ncbi:MAG TPA: hypothetical protein VJC03_08795, partial [bacterium]|nr:hypothetical protein [bacterium]
MKKIFFSAFILAVPGLFFLFYMSKTGLFMPVLDEPFSLHLSYWLGIDIEAEKALLFLSPNEKNINFDLEPVLPVSVTCEKALFSFDSSMIKRISGYGFAAAVPSSPLFVSYRARLILKKNGKRYRALKTGTLCFLTPAEKDKIPRQQQKESGIGSYPRVEYTLEDTDIGLENLKQIQEHPEAYLPPKYFYRLEEKLLDFFA